MILLYDEAYSPYCAKIRKMMDYKGLRYRTIPVPYHDKRRLLKETGQDYVPFLRDGRRGIPWTQAVDYLERRQPEPSVYPSGTRGACKVLEAWEYDWFEDRLWPFVAAYLERTFRDPVERWNFVEMWDRPYGALEAIRKDPKTAWEPIHPSIQLLEDALRDHPFLMADVPTAFDFAVYGDFHAMEYAKAPWPRAYPRLRAWYRRMKAL